MTDPQTRRFNSLAPRLANFGIISEVTTGQETVQIGFIGIITTTATDDDDVCSVD